MKEIPKKLRFINWLYGMLGLKIAQCPKCGSTELEYFDSRHSTLMCQEKECDGFID
jgi:hypothetical protein